MKILVVVIILIIAFALLFMGAERKPISKQDRDLLLKQYKHIRSRRVR